MLRFVLRILAYIPVRILFPTRVIGKKNLIKNGRLIYAVNHQSIFDAVLCCVIFPRRQCFMAKKEIFKSKLSAWFYHKIGAFPVDRGNVDMQAMRTAKEIMSKEQILTIFPQGTRKKHSDDFEGMKNGAVYIALKNHAPIQPMFIVKKPRLFRFNTIIVGEPIYLDKYYNEKPTREILCEISQNLIDQMNVLKDNFNSNKKTR